MPRPRKPENEGLPKRWRLAHGAYYYQVPKEEKALWGGRAMVRLGSTLEEAQAFFADAHRKVSFGIHSGVTGAVNNRLVRQAQWSQIWLYNESCCIPLTFLQHIYTTARIGAEARNISFDLSPFALVKLAMKAKGECMLTGIPWDFTTSNERGKRLWRPSLDRIDSMKGYTEENCRLIAAAVNIALSDFGEETLAKIAVGMTKKMRLNSKQSRD